jgi:hypothetical protein
MQGSWRRMGAGVPPGLQNRWVGRSPAGGFDSRPPPPRGGGVPARSPSLISPAPATPLPAGSIPVRLRYGPDQAPRARFAAQHVCVRARSPCQFRVGGPRSSRRSDPRHEVGRLCGRQFIAGEGATALSRRPHQIHPSSHARCAAACRELTPSFDMADDR